MSGVEGRRLVCACAIARRRDKALRRAMSERKGRDRD
jgi:hypothetical protein